MSHPSSVSNGFDATATGPATAIGPDVPAAAAEVLLPEEEEATPTWLENARERIYRVDYAQLPSEVKTWIKDHPYQTAFYVVNGVVLFAPGLLAGPLLGALGWTSLGPRAGSVASFAQSVLGPIAPGGLFATLQSSAMGGYGVAVVNTVVSGVSTGIAGLATVTGWWNGRSGERAAEEESQEGNDSEEDSGLDG